jgi:DNA mismatch repair protein MutS
MSEIEGTTPLFKQYLKFKRRFPDHIVFYRMGDFYEMFGDDAVEGAKILGIALTSRAHGKAEKIPLAGVPYHAAERYLAKLAAAGKKVVICEQVEDPRLAKGIVKRDVVEILTPGTLMLEGALSDGDRQFLVGIVGPPEAKGALTSAHRTWGLAAADVTTGAFVYDECAEAEIAASVAAWGPREIVVPESLVDHPAITGLDVAVSALPDWRFAENEAIGLLQKQFGTSTLAGFGVSTPTPGIRAGGGVLFYLRDTKRAGLAHITGIARVQRAETMALDAATITNLELLANRQTGNRAESLLGLLDRCVTPMGRRLLKDWVISPLLSVDKIEARLEAVELLVNERGKLASFTSLVAGIFDLERFLGRLGTDRINARDLISLANALGLLPELAGLFADAPGLLRDAAARVPDFAELTTALRRALTDDPPLSVTEGGLIRPGYSAELDQLTGSIRDSRGYLASLQTTLRDQTGIPSLKVGYNRVFGYYIEVTHAHKDKIPAEWVRKQTLVNAERYITEKMKAAEDLISRAEEKIFDLEYRLFLELRETVKGRMADLKIAAEVVSLWDAAASLSRAALDGQFTRPKIFDSTMLRIRGGRHPIIATLGSAGEFVPNDTTINHPGEFLHLLTGPNMAGKSTYLRQVGLIVLMAQIGSFVPAEQVELGITDRIFTRVGSADDLTKNQSTFMVEMTETATILHNATPRSLILFDEVGRGTSTYDGLSIAWAVTEHLCRAIGLRCRTIFATHYHELTALAHQTDGAANYQMAVAESEGEVTFLHRVVPGGCDDSYGIYVARLAGVPRAVVERAKEILADIEAGNFAPMLSQVLRRKIRRSSIVPPGQTALFGEVEHPVIQELKKIRIDELAPLEALNVLARLLELAKQ